MKLHYAPLSSSEAPTKRSFRGSQILSAMCLEVLRLAQAEDLFPTRRAERGNNARRWIPPPEGQGGRRWRGGDHAIGGLRSRERPITRYVNRAVRQGASPRATAWRRRAQAEAPKPGSHNAGLDDERRAQFFSRSYFPAPPSPFVKFSICTIARPEYSSSGSIDKARSNALYASNHNSHLL